MKGLHRCRIWTSLFCQLETAGGSITSMIAGWTSNVHDVVLVCGSAIHFVKKLIREFFIGKGPNRSINSVKAVAFGLCLGVLGCVGCFGVFTVCKVDDIG